MAVETSIKKPGDFAFIETSGPVIPTPSLVKIIVGTLLELNSKTIQV